MARHEDDDFDENGTLKDGRVLTFRLTMMDAASAERVVEVARAKMVADMADGPAIERGTLAAPSADPYAQMLSDMTAPRKLEELK